MTNPATTMASAGSDDSHSQRQRTRNATEWRTPAGGARREQRELHGGEHDGEAAEGEQQADRGGGVDLREALDVGLSLHRVGERTSPVTRRR